MTEVIKTAPERDALLAEVLEQYLEAVEAGTAPSHAQLLGRHPELAQELGACLGSLDFIRRAGNQESGGRSQGTGVKGHESGGRSQESGGGGQCTPSPGREVTVSERLELGDYHIIREIGRGGMGIVYEAVEQSSGRRVALKVLPFAAAFDPRQLERFKNEAKAAMLLHHPNIVPVSAVGAEGDVHFYAMEYIEGKNLAQVIAGERREAIPQSTIPLTVAKLGIQAATGLEHAHQVGIIHRDIKPANLLVGADGHLWVTDFGLALFQHEAAGLTLSGDLVGTLRYMSPEQALGKHGIVDQRADIYSLGVTLYELATLQPAFRGRDRQELLRQIADDDPCPPRRLNRDLPIPLETILLKACAKEPAARYTTARELADDLQQFLDGRPIAAKRPHFRERAWRWARRHKPIVASALVTALVALVVLAVSNVFIVRWANEAEYRAKQARQAVDEMYTQVAQRWWYQQPYMEEVQREFLQKALTFYEEFSKERGNSAELRLETVRALRRVADIQHRLGARDKAAAAYASAIERFGQLVFQYPTEGVYRDELANAHNNYGNLLRDQSRLADAEEHYRHAHDVFAALVKERPEPDYRDGLAGSLNGLATVQYSLPRPQQAEKAYREARDVLVALTRDYPDVPAYQHALATCRNNLANLLRDSSRPQEARRAYEQALTGWRKLSARMPAMPIFRQGQAASLSGLGIVYAGLGHGRDAENAHRNALALRDRLANEYPGVPVYRQALAASEHSLGRLLADAGCVKEAGQFYTQALLLRKELARKPAAVVHRQELADTYQGLARLYATTGQPFEAERIQREALALRQQVATQKRRNQDAQWDLAHAEHELGEILRRLGRLDEAQTLCCSAVNRAEELAAAFAEVRAYQFELAAMRSDLGVHCQGLSRFDEAEKLQQVALAALARLAGAVSDAPYYQRELATVQLHLGGLFQDTGRPAEAEAAYRQAIALFHKLSRDFPSVADYGRVLSLAQERLGALLAFTASRSRDHEGAILADALQMLEKARPLVDKLAGKFAQLPAYHEELARHYHALGILLSRSGRMVEAEQAFRHELGLREKLSTDFAEDPALLRDLAYMLANCPDAGLRQPRRAVEMATKAWDKNPKDAATLSILGIANYRAGDWKAAVSVLEPAERVAGKYAGNPFVLAMAHWRLGDKTKASAFYERGSARMEQYRPCDEDLRSLQAEAKRVLKRSENR